MVLPGAKLALTVLETHGLIPYDSTGSGKQYQFFSEEFY